MLTGGALFLVFAMDVKRERKLSKFAIMSKGEFVGQDVAILSNFAAQVYYTGIIVQQSTHSSNEKNEP